MKSYADAIHQALCDLLEFDPAVFVIGQGLWSPWYVGSTMTDLDKRFGRDRIIDTPVSENATTGVAIGAAMMGRRPIVVHPRMDFMLLGCDPIINQASNWSYLFSGKVKVPVVIRSIINRGGEQGAQHSQALQALFAHIPGLKVVMPGTATDARDLLIDAVYDNNPVIYIDDRWCYELRSELSKEIDPQPLGKANILRTGMDVTVVAWSYMVAEALAAAETLSDEGISVEVVDLRTVKPWDKETVLSSAKKTRRVVVAEAAWASFGVAAEITASIYGACFGVLKSPILRVGIPDCPAPAARILEAEYYPSRSTIAAAVKGVSGKGAAVIRSTSSEVPGWISQ